VNSLQSIDQIDCSQSPFAPLTTSGELSNNLDTCQGSVFGIFDQSWQFNLSQWTFLDFNSFVEWFFTTQVYVNVQFIIASVMLIDEATLVNHQT